VPYRATLAAMKKQFRLSASTLALLLDCPRCFWLQINEDIRRPQGPFPSLPGGMDAVLKTAMDAARLAGELPRELAGQVQGKLFQDQQQLDRWRDALRGDLRYRDPTRGIEVLGGIDDLVEERDGLTPVDFKTRGWPIKDDSHAHYQHQLDLYAWLLEKNGHRISGRGVLLFFSPQAYEGNGRVQFRIEPVVLRTDVNRADALLTRATKILGGPLPKRHGECAFCHYALQGAKDES